MIDDMEFHVKAWSGILNDDLQANLSDAAVRKEMYGKNDEVLERIFGKGKFGKETMKILSMEKENRYQQAYKPHLKLIKGLMKFLQEAKAKKIPLSIGSAAIPFNINFVVDGLKLHDFFPVIVSADDVAISKPHPETFLKCAEKMGVEPKNCIVFEDAPKGVEAAQNAGMKCVVVTTMHPEKEFKKYKNVLFYIKDYYDLGLKELLG
jgi:HAD superfamily hydrolase (TIGR01509 family)